MSVYNKPDLKINMGCNTPSYHKKINSMNIAPFNTGRNQQGNIKKHSSKNINNTTDVSSENNIINNNNQIIQNNNFININYYPQGNESKYIYQFLYFYIYRYNPWNK